MPHDLQLDLPLSNLKKTLQPLFSCFWRSANLALAHTFSATKANKGTSAKALLHSISTAEQVELVSPSNNLPTPCKNLGVYFDPLLQFDKNVNIVVKSSFFHQICRESKTFSL